MGPPCSARTLQCEGDEGVESTQQNRADHRVEQITKMLPCNTCPSRWVHMQWRVFGVENC